MATSYTSLLGLALPVTGELSGTWGDTVNNYISNYIDAAVAGAQTVTANTTLTKTTGASLSGTSSQYAIIIASPASANITITAPAASKIYTIINTSATYTVKIVGAGPTTGVTLNASEKAQVAWNGSDFVRIGSTSVFGSPSASMTLDTSGNIGLGATQSGWASDYRTFEMGVSSNLYGVVWSSSNGDGGANTYGQIGVGNNLTQGNKYTGTGAASYYLQSGGRHTWYSAASAAGGSALSATQKMMLDVSGNLGIGVTPSAWGSIQKVLQIGADCTLFYNNTNDFIMGLNYYTNASNANVFIANGIASAYRQNSGIHAWYYTQSGTAGGTPAFTQAMTLDASGNLLVGATSVSNGAGWDKLVQIYATNYPVLSLKNSYRQWDTTVYGSSGALIFYDATAAAERMRLDSSGNLGIGTTTITAPLSLPDTIGTAGSINRIQLYQSGGTTLYGFGISSAQLNYISGDNHVFFKKSGATSTEYMRLDTSGNLGLGVTPSAATLKTFQSDYGIYSGNLNINAVANAVYNSSWKYIGTGFATQYQQDAGKHAWLTAPSGTAGNAITFTQAMTLDASGNLLLNTTTLTSAGISTSGTFQVNTECMSRGATGGWFWENRAGGVTSSTNWYGWYTPTGSLTYLWIGSSNIASINNSTGAYTALSDRNKKKDFEPSAIGLNEVMRLKPTLFRMLDDADDSAKKLGFIAQDVADVIPQAYVEHRALDAVGKDSVYIGLDDRPFIAALTKAIQEQQAMIQSLTDRITQLEAK